MNKTTLLESLRKHHKPTYEHSLRVAEYSGEIANLENKIESNFLKPDCYITTDITQISKDVLSLISTNMKIVPDGLLSLLRVSSAYEGGLYHDIGKLSVDSSLLNLTEVNKKQYEEIKKHAKYGYDLLINREPYLACVAGKHHPDYAVEQWPEKSSSKARKIMSKYISIVTFSDFFDALMTRNNSAYKVDRQNKAEVFTMLKEYFPEQEGWM